MWLSLILLLLLLAIAYFQTIQGLFSALLSAVLCLLCAVLAFATFEYMAANVLAQFKPDYALGLSLLGMFAVPLFILRVVLDKLVHRACLLPLIVDKVGGVAFGIVAAYIMVGMLAISLQLIPFGNHVLSFARVDREDPTQDQHELWLKPDRFAVKLASMFSDGLFSGEESFSRTHPDFVTEVGWIEGVLPQQDKLCRGVRRLAPPGSMRFVRAWEESTVHRLTVARNRDAEPTYDEPKQASDGNKFIRVRMTLKPGAQDEDKKHRFTLFQVRLVGDCGDQPKQYHAIAVSDKPRADQDDPDSVPRMIYERKDRKSSSSLLSELLAPNGTLVDVAFEVPKDFTPRFVEYKSGARAAVRLGAASGTIASAGAGAAGAAADLGQPSGGGGRVSGVAVTGSFFGEGFPGGLTMTSYQGGDAELTGQALRLGHIYGEFDRQGTPRRLPPVSKFEVPSEKRLLHLSVESLKPRSLPGTVLNLAVRSVKQYTVIDNSGRRYLPVGAYVIAKMGFTPYVEIQYYPEYAEVTGRGVQPWARLRQGHIDRADTYVLLYLVEPGATLVGFSSGGGVRQMDLGDMNLTAPQ